ncbi:sulfotransferase family 2 domain-containing protein [Litoreibacter albidus]|uniref:Sulfotransferase family protein n=1 Tax=Litoreibacter albidus TaxID=670155 RepID=A0A1H2YYS5_9RHOB|nr:sulfotransferase family 2 domain-containing protein [Litoreibacter albidus]SDX10266.1 Sulfotransferase family protein [Litoreibacter albidus]
MIISEGRNYIFVHIPKTGGTSMALALEAKAKADDIMLGDTPKARKRRRRVADVAAAGRLWKHSTLRDIVGLVPQSRIDAANVFTMVRNPWDRMVSYYHWLRAQSFDHPAVHRAQELEFSDFLRHPHISASLRAAPYGSYVITAAGDEHCALFVRLEHLDEDLPKLEALIGCKLGPFPHDNKSSRGDYRDFYSSADRALVTEIAAPDIARFHYQF